MNVKIFFNHKNDTQDKTRLSARHELRSFLRLATSASFRAHPAREQATGLTVASLLVQSCTKIKEPPNLKVRQLFYFLVRPA
jgi:hypothetical protein